MKLIISRYKTNFSIFHTPASLGYLIWLTSNFKIPSLFYVKSLFSGSSHTFWLLFLSLLQFFFLCLSLRCQCFPEVLNLVCFSLCINPALSIIALATASMQMTPQTRCLLQAPLLRSKPYFCLPTKHLLPAHPQALQTHHDPHCNAYHHPLPNFSALVLKPDTTPLLNQLPSLVCTTSQNLSPLPPSFPWPYLEKHKFKTSLPSSCLGLHHSQSELK